MKLTRILSLLFTVTLSISACSGATATPTIDVVGIQNTAVAAAFTIIAETQAAIPTITPIPPTETPTQTPQPTETPIGVVTDTPTVAALATSSSGNSDPCNAPLAANPLGKSTKIKLENKTGAPITVSVYLNLTPFGQCGFRGYNIGKGGSPVITDLPQACYNVSVFVNDPDKPTKSFGYGCINNPDQWTFVITRDTVTLQGR